MISILIHAACAYPVIATVVSYMKTLASYEYSRKIFHTVYLLVVLPLWMDNWHLRLVDWIVGERQERVETEFEYKLTWWLIHSILCWIEISPTILYIYTGTGSKSGLGWTG